MSIDPTVAATAAATAVAETAKTTGKAVDLVRDFGAFFGKVLGNVSADLVGYAGGDYLGEVRVRNRFRMAQRTDEILAARQVKETAAVSPLLAIPLLSAAGDESNPELQDLWARLLANAMDPARAGDLRIEYIETIKRFHPRDALILLRIADAHGSIKPDTTRFFVGHLHLTAGAVEVSIETLVKLSCLKHHPAGNFLLTPFGRELLAACRL